MTRHNTIKVCAIVLALVISVLPVGAIAAGGPPSSTCAGGAIAPGTYQSLTVTGNCSIPSGTVTVLNNVTVGPGANLNAGFSAATVTIKGNLTVGSGAVLVLGCAISFPCAHPTTDSVGGNLSAYQPLAMIIHGNNIGGNLTVQDGGSSSPAPNGVLSADLAALGFPSEFLPVPTYSAFETNIIGKNLVVSGYTAFWIGFQRNTVKGNVAINNNDMLPFDPDGIEVAQNIVQGNLICNGNLQFVSDESEGSSISNTVSGKKLGQCSGL